MEMRRFDDLTEKEQAASEQAAQASILEDIVSGFMRFNDEANGDDIQARIDAAVVEMERMQTPWFLAERLMEDDQVRALVEGIARALVEDTYFLEPGETAQRIPEA